jgi:P-type Ca2+ transporter type 2C
MLEAHEFRERPWHSAAGKEVVSDLETDAERGLSSREAEGRLKLYGPNRIRTGEMKPWYLILLHQFTDPLIYILLLAAVVSLLFDEIVDAAVILAVVVINGTIGFIQEYRARKSIRSLAEMSAPKARIIRDGKEVEIPSEEIVPGDIVLLAAGGRVPADVRILKVSELQTDESALTGEAETVSKRVEPVEDENAVPGDQLSIAFSGTNVTPGGAAGRRRHTGDASELGHVSPKNPGDGAGPDPHPGEDGLAGQGHRVCRAPAGARWSSVRSCLPGWNSARSCAQPLRSRWARFPRRCPSCSR